MVTPQLDMGFRGAEIVHGMGMEDSLDHYGDDEAMFTRGIRKIPFSSVLTCLTYHVNLFDYLLGSAHYWSPIQSP